MDVEPFPELVVRSGAAQIAEPLDLNALEAAAKVAPGSAWEPERNGPRWRVDHASALDKGVAADLTRFIAAASPDVVLRLVGELRALSRAIDEHEGERAAFHRRNDELAAELAAYEGRPEGALNEHWYWEGTYWVRTLEDGVKLHAHPRGWCVLRSPERPIKGKAGSWRASMISVEEKAIIEGWLS
jgi:hypothetical protein